MKLVQFCLVQFVHPFPLPIERTALHFNTCLYHYSKCLANVQDEFGRSILSFPSECFEEFIGILEGRPTDLVL
jgi:hypothetical protein